MKAKCLVAVVGILLLTLLVWFVKSPSGEPSKIYDRDAPSTVRRITFNMTLTTPLLTSGLMIKAQEKPSLPAVM